MQNRNVHKQEINERIANVKAEAASANVSPQLALNIIYGLVGH
jgi:hypothetical protein